MISLRSSVRVRHSASRIFAVAMLFAATAYAGIAFSERQIDEKRREQLRVARLENEVTAALGDLDSLLLGEEVEEIDGDLQKLGQGYASVFQNAGREGEAVRASYTNFLKAAADQREAVRKGNMPRARQLDREETDPAFEGFQASLDKLNGELQAEATLWANAIDAAIGGSLLLCAALVAGLIVREQRKIEAMARMEAQQATTEESERRFRSLIRNSADVIALVSPDGTFAMVSDACERAWGQSADALVGRSVLELVETPEAPRLRRALAECVQGDLTAFEIALKSRPFEVQATSLLDDPSVGAVLLTFHDLTERKKHESEMAYHAFHDRLTGLPNRALFLDRLSHRLAAFQAGDESFAALFIDLDNFKIVNDSLGHEAGDSLLIQVAARLKEAVRPVDTVARMGGDEFTIILDEATAQQAALEVAERIQRTLVLPVSLGEREVFVTCSIGVVMAQDSGPDAASLLRDADTAMYHAKGDGKATVALFEPRMNLQALDRLELETDLRAATAGEDFYLVYQPIVDLASGRLREVEALIRWNHPVRGLIPPATFIPLAEETGLIGTIGRWAMGTSLRQLAEWNQGLEGDDRLKLSVNVSARQFQDKGFVAEVHGLLEETGLDPHLVELEVTETAMLNDLTKMKAVFAELRSLGLRVAIDDFGTGYSSMAYLSQLPVDKLKIDRSFVIPLGADERAEGVVQAMITMARTLGLRITGEGVETEEQLATLQDMGCDLGQGYLFDRPLSADSVAQIIAEGHAPAELLKAA